MISPCELSMCTNIAILVGYRAVLVCLVLTMEARGITQVTMLT